MEDHPPVRWYGERGIVNALVTHIADAPVQRTSSLLSAVKWADDGRPTWPATLSRVALLIEWGLADFGNPDLLIIAESRDGPRCIFLEAKIGPYVASMMPNHVGMRGAGFNSSINGQLALKYRFGKALHAARSPRAPIEEPDTLLRQYQLQLHDPRSTARRLAKPEIVRLFTEYGLLGLSEDRCRYVALTWDADTRPFFRDAFVAQHDGLPYFLDEHGHDMYATSQACIGWLGYQHLHAALDLARVPQYQSVFHTMVPALEPDAQAYAAAENGFLGDEISPESLVQATKLQELFKGYKVVERKGSFSILEDGQTIAKIIPKRNVVFVGIRDTKTPSNWFSGPLDRVSISGVHFCGLHVAIEHPDEAQLLTLVSGLSRVNDVDS